MFLFDYCLTELEGFAIDYCPKEIECYWFGCESGGIVCFHLIIIASQNWRAFGSRISALFGFMEIFVFGFFMLRIETKRKVCIVEFG